MKSKNDLLMVEVIPRRSARHFATLSTLGIKALVIHSRPLKAGVRSVLRRGLTKLYLRPHSEGLMVLVDRPRAGKQRQRAHWDIGKGETEAREA